MWGIAYWNQERFVHQLIFFKVRIFGFTAVALSASHLVTFRVKSCFPFKRLLFNAKHSSAWRIIPWYSASRVGIKMGTAFFIWLFGTWSWCKLCILCLCSSVKINYKQYLCSASFRVWIFPISPSFCKEKQSLVWNEFSRKEEFPSVNVYVWIS